MGKLYITTKTFAKRNTALDKLLEERLDKTIDDDTYRIWKRVDSTMHITDPKEYGMNKKRR